MALDNAAAASGFVGTLAPHATAARHVATNTSRGKGRMRITRAF